MDCVQGIRIMISDMLSLRCLLDIQVKILNSQYLLSSLKVK